jgi:hypothetical protein
MDMKIQNKKYVTLAEAGIRQVIESYIPKDTGFLPPQE